MLVALLCVVARSADPGLPAPTHHVAPKEVHQVLARDGARLRTVMFRPREEGRYPTVFTRTPYPLGFRLAAHCRRFVRRGYACGWQEVRGTMHSAEPFTPFEPDVADGQDAVAWVRSQPWSDGQIAWVGDSYMAGTGWAVAMGDPDGVSTLVSRVFAPPLYHAVFEDGLLRHEVGTAWMTKMAGPSLLHSAPAYRRALAHRPRSAMDEAAVGEVVPWFRAWVSAEAPEDPWWSEPPSAPFEQAADDLDIPVLLIGGWSDAFIEGQIDAWSRLPGRRMLVVGPWSHIGLTPSALPLRHRRGEHAGRAGMAQLPRVLAWMDARLKGAAPRYRLHGAATYVVGGDRWELRDSWPPRTEARRFGLVAREGRCDGALVEGAGPLTRALTWVYDPADPLPSRGGAGILAGSVPLSGGVRPGFQRVANRCPRRTDVVHLETAPLTQPLHFAGTVSVDLLVSSTAPDTAFGFRLLLRRPGGRLIMLREGFATLGLRTGVRTPYTPGDRVALRADAQPLEAEVQPGESLVLVLTSSSFPVVEAHPNVAGVLAHAIDPQPATQTVFAGTLVIPEVVGR